MTGKITPHTDIRAQGWILYLPESMRPYILLARLDRPAGTWLLFLPGIWGIFLAEGSSTSYQIWLGILFAIGSLAMRSAGCVVNDIWDRDIDAQVSRTASRPLANGQLAISQALILLALLLLIGALVLLQLPLICWKLAIIAMILLCLYPAAKRITWWPQLVMGFTFGFGAPMGYAASAGKLDTNGLVLYGGTILWQLGFDTIYGFQDMEDDARIGVRSTSRLWADHPRLFISACYTGASICFLWTATRASLYWTFWPIALCACALLFFQISRLNIQDPARCLTLFRQNVPFGLIMGLAFICGRLML